MIKVLKVATEESFVLICELSDGCSYRYDMSSIQKENGEMISSLKDPSFFKKAYIDSGALSWPNGYEIYATTVIREGEKISDEAS